MCDQTTPGCTAPRALGALWLLSACTAVAVRTPRPHVARDPSHLEDGWQWLWGAIDLAHFVARPDGDGSGHDCPGPH